MNVLGDTLCLVSNLTMWSLRRCVLVVDGCVVRCVVTCGGVCSDVCGEVHNKKTNCAGVCAHRSLGRLVYITVQVLSMVTVVGMRKRVRQVQQQAAQHSRSCSNPWHHPRGCCDNVFIRAPETTINHFVHY